MKINKWLALALVIAYTQIQLWVFWHNPLFNVIGLIGWGIALVLTVGVSTFNEIIKELQL